ESLAAYRIFNRLARLHEASQAGIHAFLKMMAAPEQAAIPLDIDRQHDDDRIGPGKDQVLAGCTEALIAADPALHATAAFAAKAVGGVPVDQRCRLRHLAEKPLVQQALSIEGPCLDRLEASGKIVCRNADRNG